MDKSVWATVVKTNFILADIFDAISQLNANIVAIGSGKPAKKIVPYPRPIERSSKNDESNTTHIGSGALPVSELEAWFERKRAENGGND